MVLNGILSITTNDAYLFAYTEDWSGFRTENAIQLVFQLPPDAPKNWGTILDGKRVQVEGVLVAPEPGHVYTAGGGVLKDITRVWEIQSRGVHAEPPKAKEPANTKLGEK